MAVSKELSRFTRDALVSGKTRAQISQALTAAGWAASEVREALDAWAETPFSPPIPRPQTMVSARDFFVYTLMFGVMIFGAVSVVQLFHALIDGWMNDAQYRAGSRIRWAMAVLITGRMPLLPTRVMSIADGTPIKPSSGMVTLGFSPRVISRI